MRQHHILTAACAAVLLAFAAPASHAAAAAPASAQAAQPQAKRQLDAIAAAYYEALARFDPIISTERGDNRFDGSIGKGIWPAERARQFARYRQFQAQLNKVSRDQLDRGAQITYDILNEELKTLLAFEPFPEYLLPLNHMNSMPTILGNYASGEAAQPLRTVKDYRLFLSRLSQLDEWTDQAIANMREGMRKGVVLPRALVAATLPQYRQLVSDTAEASLYYKPVLNMPASFSPSDRVALTRAYRAAVAQQVNPAVKRLIDFLEREYMPAARTSAGWSALPNGAAWYQAHVVSETTTNMTPEQIHEIGLREVAHLQHEFAAVGKKMGYDGVPAGLPTWVSKQPQYFPFKTEAEILEQFRKIDAEVRTKLPSLFTLRPKAPLEVRMEPELTRATASNHYTPPSQDGTRPGIFWAVVPNPVKHNSTGMPSLFLHEGQPGHHFQIALQQELDMPNFRKFGGNNAFVEGWALYAETLGNEMGVFEKPEHYFGHLNYAMLRAVRLVVDTGIHAKGWTREQGIQYMMDTLGYGEPAARNAIERYMAWPGQALGYMIGKLKIAELRARASAALGAQFSLPEFHRIVLEDGSLPLSLLEAKVDRWIASTKK